MSNKPEPLYKRHDQARAAEDGFISSLPDDGVPTKHVSYKDPAMQYDEIVLSLAKTLDTPVCIIKEAFPCLIAKQGLAYLLTQDAEHAIRHLAAEDYPTQQYGIFFIQMVSDLRYPGFTFEPRPVAGHEQLQLVDCDMEQYVSRSGKLGKYEGLPEILAAVAQQETPVNLLSGKVSLANLLEAVHRDNPYDNSHGLDLDQVYGKD